MFLIAMALAAQQASIEDVKVDLQASPQATASVADGVEIVRLVIAPDGRAAGCSARILGLGPVEDRANCKKLSKMTATPAIDHRGSRVYGAVEFRLIWVTDRLTGSRASPPAGAADLYLPLQHIPDGLRRRVVDLRLVVASDGKVENCETVTGSGRAALDKAACDAAVSGGVAPLKDASGTPVRGVQNLSIGFVKQ